MGKATGIGGIFIKYRDPDAMRTWFETALELTPNDYGVLFGFNEHPGKRAYLQLGTFPESSDYFGQKEQAYMLNFRVEDLYGLQEHLLALGVTVCDTIETYAYGRFLHIEDPEGNRIELWEPVDDGFGEEPFVTMR